MGRVATIGVAIVLTLGLAAGATQAGKKKAKKVKTEAEIELIDFTPGGTDLSGDIHSRKPKCEKGRVVNVVYTGSEPGVPEPVVTTTTDRTGDWAAAADEGGPGPFVVEVDRRRIGQGEKRLVCKSATSPEVSALAP